MSIDCRIKPVNVCDKDLTGPSVYYPGVLYEPGSSVPPAVEADLLQQFKYDHQESTETFDSNEEVEVLKRVWPINETSSAAPWRNDTVEVFRTCPAFGPIQGGIPLTVIGRNFQDSPRLTCRFTTINCTDWEGEDDIKLRQCSAVGSAYTKGTWISETRIACTAPVVQLRNVTAEVDFSAFDPSIIRETYTTFDTVIDVSNTGDRFSENFPSLLNYTQSCVDALLFPDTTGAWAQKYRCGFAPDYFNADGIDRTTQLSRLDDMANLDDVEMRPYQDAPMFRYVQMTDETDPDAQEYYADRFGEVPSFVVEEATYKRDWHQHRQTCRLEYDDQEAFRPSEKGWYLLPGFSLAKLEMDFRHLYPGLVYDEHWKIAIYVMPSQCVNAECAGQDQVYPPRELAPCRRPLKLPDSFLCNDRDCPQPTIPLDEVETPYLRSIRRLPTHPDQIEAQEGLTSVNKHDVMNFTLMALEDVIFKVEIHITHGLFLPSESYFRNTTSVNMVSPSRAYVLNTKLGDDLTQYDIGGNVHDEKVAHRSRQLSRAVSFSETMVPDAYTFLALYDRQQTDIEPPLNLPPVFEEFEKGRVLVSYNASGDSLQVPFVHDRLSTTEDQWSKIQLNEKYTTVNFEKYRETFVPRTDEVDGGNPFNMLPYLPYFSNCKAYDSYIPLFEMMEGDQCQLPAVTFTDRDQLIGEENPGKFPFEKAPYGLPEGDGTPSVLYDDTWWRREYPPIVNQDDIYVVTWGSMFAWIFQGGASGLELQPVSDWCEQSISCAFEEYISFESLDPDDNKVHWYEAGDGDEIFSILNRPKNLEYYQNGQVNLKEAIDSGEVTSDDFVPVGVAWSDAYGEYCETQTCVPSEMTLDIGYYQYDKSQKKIITASLTFENSHEVLGNPVRTDYTLHVRFRPLSFFALINNFALEPYEQFEMLFVIIGLASVAVALMFYYTVYFTTRLRNRPKLNFIPYFIIIATDPFHGVYLAWVPISALLFAIYLAVYLDSEGVITLYSGMADHWTSLGGDVDDPEGLTSGRLGLSFFCLGSCMIVAGSKIFIPHRVSKREMDAQKDRDKNAAKESIWVPTTWKRSNMIFVSYMMAMLCVAVIDFSVWFEEFGDYIWHIILILKVFEIIVEVFVDRMLKEHLLICPVMTSFAVVQGFVTFGADDFVDFLLSYFVEFLMIIVQRVFIDPGAKELVDMSRIGLAHVARFVRKKLNIKRKMGIEIEVFVLDEDGKAARKKRDVDEMVAEGTETVEPILDAFTVYANETLALVLQPFLIFFLLILFRKDTLLADYYGIKERDMVFYLAFAATIQFFQLTSDVLIMNAQELFHGWKIYDYLVYTRYRFLQREKRWKGLESNLDECIEEGMRTLDQMCFSSQFYLMNTIHTTGIILVVFAIFMMAKTNYNAFGDPMLVILGPMVVCMCICMKHFCFFMMRKLSLWKIKHEDTAWNTTPGMDDDGDFDIPGLEDIQGASHEAYLMNQRITSETFRYKFLNYNRAWLVSQLPSILTPRTMKRSRPYLVQQFVKIIDKVNPDVSSDSESDDDGKPKFPPVHLSAASRNMVRMWLAQARRRKRLKEVVQPLINKARKTECESCLSRKQLQVELIIPIEVMGDKFEKNQPDTEEFDQMAWKAFWTKHQKYRTLCLDCVQKRKEADKKKATDMAYGVQLSDSSDSDDNKGEHLSNDRPYVCVSRCVVRYVFTCLPRGKNAPPVAGGA
jgi:hypothetical protein